MLTVTPRAKKQARRRTYRYSNPSLAPLSGRSPWLFFLIFYTISACIRRAQRRPAAAREQSRGGPEQLFAFAFQTDNVTQI